MPYYLTAQLQSFVLGSDQYCFVFAKNELGEINQFLVNYAGEVLDAGDLDVIPDGLLKLVQSSQKRRLIINRKIGLLLKICLFGLNTSSTVIGITVT